LFHRLTLKKAHLLLLDQRLLKMLQKIVLLLQEQDKKIKKRMQNHSPIKKEINNLKEFIMTDSQSNSDLKIYALSSNRPLAKKIADDLGVKLGDVTVSKFSDGETRISPEESNRGSNVYIIQSTSAPTNDNLMELLIMIDALKRASAKTIN